MEKAAKETLQIPSLPSLHSLPQDFIDEALILSDILDLNEISSVELLLAGERQLPRYAILQCSLQDFVKGGGCFVSFPKHYFCLSKSFRIGNGCDAFKICNYCTLSLCVKVFKF